MVDVKPIRIAAALWATTLATALAMAYGEEPAPAPPAPNFLIIVTDDMGYTDLGAFGGDDIATPNLDRLALEGLRLTNFHTAPSCAPTRAMLMSGNGNHEAGIGTQLVYEEFEDERNYERYLHERIAALPEVIDAAGYHTVLSGKWHLGFGAPTDDLALPANRGFDQTFALLHGADSHLQSVYVDEAAFSEDGAEIPDPLFGHYSTTLFADKLIEKIDAAQTEEPFFAVFAPTAPHWPLHAPPGWMEKYRGAYDAGYDALCHDRMKGARAAGVLPDNADISECPKTAAPWDELSEEDKAFQRRVMEIYAGMSEHLDLEIGRIITHLEEKGALENTWIFFFNDNGAQGGGFNPRNVGSLRRTDIDNGLDNLGEADSWTNIGAGWADALTAPFKGSKATQYEGGIRTPAFVWRKGVAGAGGVKPQFLTAMDIMPTILDLAGAPAPEGTFEGRAVLPMRGRSFTALLAGDDQPIHDPNQSIALDSAGRSVLFKGDYKIVRDIRSDWALYNIAADPGERHDLAAQEPELLNALTSEFNAAAAERNYLRRH